MPRLFIPHEVSRKTLRWAWVSSCVSINLSWLIREIYVHLEREILQIFTHEKDPTPIFMQHKGPKWNLIGTNYDQNKEMVITQLMVFLFSWDIKHR